MDEFYALLMTKLIAECPYDYGKRTGDHMKDNITLADYGDYWEITISGPGAYDYAKAVNYNRQRTVKEARNYHWVERALRETAEIMGGNIEYELS